MRPGSSCLLLQRDAVAAMQRIKPSELGLLTVEASASLPRHVVEALLRDFTRPTDWRDAFDQFFADEPPTGLLDDLKRHGQQTRRGLAQFLPPKVFAGGLPRTAATDDAHRAKFDISLFAQVRAENIGRLMAEGLHRISDRYGIPDEDDLVDYFTHRGGRDIRLLRSLAKGFRHFWNGDYESCIYLITPRLETAARSLLLELDEGIYRVEAGKDPGGYPGLYVLLDKLEEIALDESWTYFLRWLLLGQRIRRLGVRVPSGAQHQEAPDLRKRGSDVLCGVSAVDGGGHGGVARVPSRFVTAGLASKR